MIKNLFVVVILITLFSSCEKHGKFNKMSGVYEVYKYEAVYYNESGGVDSTFTREDIGEIGLAYNDSDTYNSIQRNWDMEPRSWSYWGVGEIYGLSVGWYLDQVQANTITFFSEGEYFDYFVLYTIKNKVGKKMEWTTVLTNAQGGIRVKETLYVKKQ